MALTDAQKVKVRRYCGYEALGSTAAPNWGFRYFGKYGDLEFRMANLSPDEESTVVNLYLPNLEQLEQDIYLVRDNSDTARAAVWYRNPYEFRERKRNYDYWRKQLCDFIGVNYGTRLLNESQVRISI